MHISTNEYSLFLIDIIKFFYLFLIYFEIILKTYKKIKTFLISNLLQYITILYYIIIKK